MDGAHGPSVPADEAAAQVVAGLVRLETPEARDRAVSEDDLVDGLRSAFTDRDWPRGRFVDNMLAPKGGLNGPEWFQLRTLDRHRSSDMFARSAFTIFSLSQLSVMKYVKPNSMGPPTNSMGSIA